MVYILVDDSMGLAELNLTVGSHSCHIARNGGNWAIQDYRIQLAISE